MENNNQNSNSINNTENNIYKKAIFPEKYIKENERDKLAFSIENIFKVLNKLSDIPAKTYYEKNNLKVMQYKNTFLDDKFLFGRMEYKLYKNNVPKTTTLEDLYNMTFDINKRLSWDKSIKSIEILEDFSEDFKDLLLPDNIYNINDYRFVIAHTWCKSPILLVSERDFVEKKVFIRYNKNKSGLLFSTSIPVDFYPNKKACRCDNIINVQIFEEYDDHWLITCYGQSNLKMPLPEKLINFTIPGKFLDWFEEFKKAINNNIK